MYITSNASVNTETKATLCLYKSGNGNGSCIRLEIPVQILYLSSARSTNRVVPTTTKFSLLLNLIRQNGRRQQLRFVIKFRYTTSSPPRPSPSSIELTSNGRGKKKNLVHEFPSLSPDPSSGSFSHEISRNCLSRNLEIGYFARPFFTRSTDYQSNRAGYRGDFSSF